MHMHTYRQRGQFISGMNKVGGSLVRMRVAVIALVYVPGHGGWTTTYIHVCAKVSVTNELDIGMYCSVPSERYLRVSTHPPSLMILRFAGILLRINAHLDFRPKI